MNRERAILLGIFTAWPVVYVFVFVALVLLVVAAGLWDNKGFQPPEITIIAIFVLHFLTMLDVAVLLVIYIIDLFKSERVPKEQKTLWAVVLFLGNIIAMPVYWYLYIWSEPKPPALDRADRGTLR